MLDILEYSMRIFPGLLLILLTYVLLPGNSSRVDVVKIFLLVFGFLLIRDVMTPLGFWRFGITGPTLWLRFIEDEMILIALGFMSLLVTFIVVRFNPSMSGYLIWFGSNKMLSFCIGVLGAAAVIAPFFFLYSVVPIEQRGGVPSLSLLVLLFFSLSGNFMEEVLFRGYLQGYFTGITGPWRSAALSGLLFAAGHIFLAATVTDLGFPILIFTLYEGFVCAMVRMKYGVVAATLTHGVTIFALASGLF
mgnify:CR=1 FL=1|jgi:CAAX amino terminal protease family.